MVEVDTHDPAADADADAIVACGGYHSVKGAEGERIVHAGSACSPRHIWHFGLVAVSQLIFPAAELPIGFLRTAVFFHIELARCVSFRFLENFLFLLSTGGQVPI